MPDRIVRDELWLSERFLDLPTDAARLAFLRFLAVCDDFGNFEGGPRRIFRMLQACTQVKSEDASVTIMDALMACDLLRRYEVEAREFFHIPRFKSHRQYMSRAYPCSPWCDATELLGKQRRTIINRGLAKELVTTKLLRSSGVAEGVGVGVGESNPLVRKKPPDRSVWQPDWFEDFYAAYPRKEKRKDAIKAWDTEKPTADIMTAIMRAVAKAKDSEQWRKDRGQYIPLPGSWLRGERWKDQPTAIEPENRMGKFVT